MKKLTLFKKGSEGLVGSTIIVIILTIIIKAASVYKDVVVAQKIGLSEVLDYFFIASMLPMFVLVVFTSSFSASLIPVIAELTLPHISIGAKKEKISRAFGQYLVLLLGVILLIILSEKILLRVIPSKLSEESISIILQMYRWLLPYVLMSGICSFFMMILHSQKKFFLSSITPVFTPLITIFFVLALDGAPDGFKLVLGVVIGSLLELVIVFIILKKSNLFFLPNFNLNTPFNRQISAQLLPMIAGSFIMSGTGVVDQYMATWLSEGSISILNYANKFPTLISGIAASALATVSLPYLSQKVEEARFDEIKNGISRFTLIVLMIFIPITFVGFYFSDFFVQLLFERGRFSKMDTISVAGVLSLSVLQIPFYVLGTLYARCISAIRGNHILMYGAIINFALNITLNYYLMNLLGLKGIALSTTLVYLVSTSFLLIALLKKLNTRIRGT